MIDICFAVIGSRSFSDYDVLRRVLDEHIELALKDGTDHISLVSGGAIGADSLAERYADEHCIHIIVIKPDYKTHGKSAPFVRNKEIIDVCDKVLAFWDGSSRGTKHATDYAVSVHKHVTTVFFSSPPKKSFFDG